jgi:Smg protein
MKENVIDVLMFLFDNYLNPDSGMYTDEASLTFELEEAGFETGVISKAFDWLHELSTLKDRDASFVQTPKKSLRVYSNEEQNKLSPACRGFLLSLEQMGVLECATREMIIDRAMAIETPKLNLKQFKRIVGLIMLNGIKSEEILVWLEDLIYDDFENSIH